MEGFIYDADYAAVIGDVALRVVSQCNADVRRCAEDAAQEEISGYLRDRYDVDAIFRMRGSERHALIVMYLCDIALWNMAATLPQKMGMEIRQERYERALSWLEKVQSGVIVPNLPPAGGGSSAGDGTDDGSNGGIVKYGSMKRQDNVW